MIERQSVTCSQFTLCNNSGQVVHTSASVTEQYNLVPMQKLDTNVCNGRLWKRCGLPSMTLPVQDVEIQISSKPVCQYVTRQC